MACASLSNRLSRVETSQPPPPAPRPLPARSPPPPFLSPPASPPLASTPPPCLPPFLPAPSPPSFLRAVVPLPLCLAVILFLPLGLSWSPPRTLPHHTPRTPLPKPSGRRLRSRKARMREGNWRPGCVCVAAAVAAAASGPLRARTGLWEQSESPPHTHTHLPRPKGNQSNQLPRNVRLGGQGCAKPQTALGTTKLPFPGVSLRAEFLNAIIIMINRCLI